MGMGGVQRTAKFTKFLSHFGWQPHVLTVNPSIYLASDELLLKEVEDSGVVIHRTGVKNGNNGSSKVVKFKKDSNRKFLSNLSQVFLIPDSKILWKNKAITLAEKIINDNGIDLIFSTAPPYTDFLIAIHLKEKFNIPVVLDYRDSWIDCPNNFYPTPFHKNRHKLLEKKVLAYADSIVTINPRIKELIIDKYPFVKDESIKIIPHGFDQEDFDKQSPDIKHRDKFTITYSGSFLNYYTPMYFLDALKIISDKNPGIKNNFEALFVGYFPDEHKKYAEEIGVLNLLRFTGYVDHDEAIRYLLSSDVLWMMIKKTGKSDLHSTGKLYEYFGARKPILACVPNGVARETLNDYGAVKVTEPDDAVSIAGAIIEFYKQYQNKSLPLPNEKVISKYDRKKLTGVLASVFDNISTIETEKALLQ